MTKFNNNFVEKEIDDNKFKTKYSDKNICALNNLSYVHNDLISSIKKNCKEYIVTIRSKPINHIDLDKLHYILGVSDSVQKIYNDITEVYDDFFEKL